MAKQHSVAIVDDIDGGKAAETVSFALDGAQYEIDLNKKNAAALRKAFADYVDSGRKVTSGGLAGRRTRPSTTRSRVSAPESAPEQAGKRGRKSTAKPSAKKAPTHASKPSTKKASKRAAKAASGPASAVSDVRQWAQEQGIAVSARGRISAAVHEQFAQAHA